MREHEGAAGESRPLTIRDYKPGPRRMDQVDWPGSDRPVWLLYLHCAEIQAAYFAARRWFEDQGQAVDQTATAWFELEFRYQLAARMLLGGRDPQRKLFRNVEAVRRELTTNELDYLMAAHERIETAEAAGWAGELRDPTLRRIAALLDLPVTASPDEVLEALAGKL